MNSIGTITPNALLSNPKVLEKWLENSLAYKDYIRLGLINLDYKKLNEETTNPDLENNILAYLTSCASNSSTPFRLCTLNASYQLCKSYPALFLVSKETTDECIRKNSKCHRQNRLPIIVWQHPVNKCLLMRSSTFHGKGFIGMLMKNQTNNTTSNETNASLEQDKYINQIVKLTRFFNTNNENNIDSLHNHCSTLNTNNHISSSFNVYTPSANRRSIFTNKIEKAVQNIKTNYNSANSNTSNPSVSSLSSSSDNGNVLHPTNKVVFNPLQLNQRKFYFILLICFN